jgi:hypothetical protein
LLCPPVAVAVLRYRLWDLHRLISRTLAWVLVTDLLILPYLLILPAVTRLAGDAASLAVAVFQPLRRRVQDLVDRRFNRCRYDEASTMEGFAARLASRSTWKCSRPSCWRWSSGRYSRLGRRCGYARRSPRGRRGSTVITAQHDSHLSTQHPRPG